MRAFRNHTGIENISYVFVLRHGCLKFVPIFLIFLFAGCSKEIEEPRYKNKGKNIIYIKIDEQEFLIKEGFSLNRNVIRADIVGQGPKGDNNPTYMEGEYFGKKYIFLSIDHKKKSKTDHFGTGIWDISIYENGEPGFGIPNGIMVNFYSKKHDKWITINTHGHGWPGEFRPRITLLHHNKEKQTISATYETSYFDNLDTSLTGEFYMYFDIEYDKL